MTKIKGLPSKSLHPIPIKKFLMFNYSFSKFLTKIISPTQYLILNKNLSENTDNDDDYKFSLK